MAIKASCSISLARINDGISITSTTSYYLANNSTAVPALTDSNWTTNTVLPTKEKPKLWHYISTKLSDNSVSNSSPVIIAYYSEDGKSVQSISQQYYVSTSKTTQTGGSWQDNQPNWEDGKFLWIRSRIVYLMPNNSTSTETTAPYVDSAWEKVTELNSKLDNLKVGGRNLLTGSKTMVKDCSYNKGCTGPHNSGTFAGAKYWTVPVPSGSDYNQCIAGRPTGMTKPPLKGEQITLSFYAQSAGTKAEFDSYLFSDKTGGANAQKKIVNCSTQSQIGIGYADGTAKQTATPTLTKYFVTWEYLEDAAIIPQIIVARIRSSAGSNLHVLLPKLEIATHPSDWSPAPEDTSEEIDTKVNAAKTSVKAEIKVETDQIKSQVEAITTRTDKLESGLDETKKNLEASKAIYIDIIETPSGDNILYEATVFRDNKTLTDFQVTALGALNWYSGSTKIGTGKSITRTTLQRETIRCRLETGGG